jgi:hypothetical protein
MGVHMAIRTARPITAMLPLPSQRSRAIIIRLHTHQLITRMQAVLAMIHESQALLKFLAVQEPSLGVMATRLTNILQHHTGALPTLAWSSRLLRLLLTIHLHTPPV